MSLVIRPLCEQDVEALVQLSLLAWEPVFESMRQVLGPYIYTSIWPDWRTSQRAAVQTICVEGGETRTCVAELDGTVVGFLSYRLHAEDKTGEVLLLAVHPAYQNRGIGTALNEFALCKMQECGMQMAKVETGGDPGHAPARSCYEKAGYTVLPLVRYFRSLRIGNEIDHDMHHGTSGGQMKGSFPVIASILSPEALAKDVLPGFGLGEVAECHFYTGGFNHTYQVRTQHAGTYYLRAYRRRWRTLPDVQYELDVLNHLKRKGFPAVQPLPYQDGQYFCAVAAPEGRRYLALFIEAPGVEIDYAHEPENVARRYGQAVARMHNALDDFTSPHPRFHKDLEHFIDRPLRHIEPFLAHRPKDWTYLQHFAATLRERLLELPESQLEQGFCHGDLQGYHARVTPDGTLTFYDFDCGGYGYRAYDLAVFLWCCRLEDAVAARWDAFLGGYREFRSMDDLDVQAVPLFVCARYLWHMGVHTQNSPDWGIGFLNEAYFDDHLQRLRNAEADYLV
ncbi:MAG: GNAT family N-acetyltransferase [Chloroflexia bacterium]|nr:GNAT family N-acetyltransferase [Chloroflexia bacterium]